MRLRFYFIVIITQEELFPVFGLVFDAIMLFLLVGLITFIQLFQLLMAKERKDYCPGYLNAVLVP